ncbi:MAG: PP2C family protein-serine/threonine phosphatase [Planctomycetota bacterium]|jgi:serine phosphatase RsbU (regulator of sigma subunit)
MSAGLTRARTATSEVFRNALAAAVQCTSAGRGLLVLRDAGDVLRLVSRYTRDACAADDERPGGLADVVRRAVGGNRSAVLTVGPDGGEAPNGSSACTAMATPIRRPPGRPRGALCVDRPCRAGGFVRCDCTMLKGFADEISAALDAEETRRRLSLRGEGGFEATFAEDIQRGLMPAPREDLGACEAGLAVLKTPELGGGFLRLAPLGDGSHAVLAGRVSGKGAPAALVAVKIGEAFRLLAPSVRGAAELLQALDEAAAEGLRHEMRASAAVLVLDADGCLADVALAGCSCMGLGALGAAMWCPDEGRSLGVHVPGVGPAPPAATSAHLDPGDGVLLLTSGCLNARSPTGERYGRHRAEAFARANADSPVDAFAEALAADIERFRAGAARTSDGAIAFVRRKTAA